MLKKVIILLLFPLLLCSCTKKNVREEITFSSWGSVTEVEILDKIIDKFENDNPQYKINFIHVPQNYFQKIHLLFASSTSPDVIFINNLYLPVYANKLMDLSDYQDKNLYYPESIEALTYDDKLLAIPRDISTLVFYRNKNLISQKPNNLAEMMQVVSKSDKFGVSFERNVYYMFPYVLTFGEDIYNPKKSLEFYKNLEGKYAPAPSDVGSLTQAQMFLKGQIGLYMSGRWLYPKISKEVNFDWDVIPFCGVVPIDASGWAISKDSRHEVGAKKFINYLASEESSRYFLESGLVVPARVNVAKDIDCKVFLDVIKKSKVLNIKKDYMQRVDKMNKEFFSL